MISKIYKSDFLNDYKYVLIFSYYKGQLLLSKHKKRQTWETQGGKIEEAETHLEAAKRELYEESGAIEYDIKEICDYWAKDDTHEACGKVYIANIYALKQLPSYSEMREIELFTNLPSNLTYPDLICDLYHNCITSTNFNK